MSEYEHATERLSDDLQKKRIKVACNNCRKKKIKCDGATVCTNCQVTQEPECIYDEKLSRPPRKKQRTLKLDEVLTYLNSRLDRLEALIQSVASSIPGNNATQPEIPVKAEPQAFGFGNEDGESSDATQDEDKVASPSDIIGCTGKPNELYLGNHSFFSIISKSSLTWMKGQLSEKNEHLIVPLINLPYVFENKTRSFARMWLDPNNSNHCKNMELIRSPLPNKKEAIFDLFEKYKNSFNAVQALCLIEEIETFLTKYYSTTNPNKRNLLLIDLFKLSLAILICLSDAMETLFDRACDDPAYGPNKIPIKDLTPKEISNLRDGLIHVCMCYFYQLGIRSQGIETVKAMLFLGVFLTKCYEPPEIIHIVFTLAIRKALDTGLHRIETYRNCSREGFESRLLVWKIACYFDMEICFRSGKPPIINYSDMSEELRNSFSVYEIVNKSYPLPFLRYYDMIFEVRLDTYNRLFSASADTKTFQALQANVDILNQKMFNLLAQMTPDHRPYFFNQPGFEEVRAIYNIDEEHRLTARLTFFLNMMIINRLPTMFAFPGVTTEQTHIYKNLSLNSARTIMHMLKNFHSYGPGKAPSLWIAFFPLISVLHLLAACMSDPKSLDAHSDILLIIQMCETWFNRKLSADSFCSFKLDMSLLLQVFVKSVANIAISIFEMNTGIAILANNEKIRDSFEAPRKLFPELFGNAEHLKKLIPYIFESKSPFPGDGTPTLIDNEQIHGNLSEGAFEENMPPNGGAGYGSLDFGIGLDGLENLLFDQLDQFPNFFFDGVGGGL
ncbi:hypothetical protein METBIDRAFT_77396 [Metschnikowia bicuspidata var. bicuspidata NRRL YB-4993]|uniref:Zn(2)-C6 fungal-type domain-containing protein n=1 Tax=Metschnikowia bicuspidata var. bicuspidata NRRL YB-4993 TaxID=869754 RepID=A0A1A0HCK2_9ASCO|nr:hypothetical protein METBIDRAFT_77396 [Metschnikowia bicuspidata var. bicuspidata NRRL YB-4993]OBA21834.1 hypothetical protein METBIDRAFT_77396 [Metschnikowia bicuspidata var. bicuspidata NRRL YB-4993]